MVQNLVFGQHTVFILHQVQKQTVFGLAAYDFGCSTHYGAGALIYGDAIGNEEFRLFPMLEKFLDSCL